MPEEITEEGLQCEVIDLAIVGAGLSGLAAAKFILEKECNVSVTLFEKLPHAGGHIGGPAGRWITSAHSHVIEMCAQLGIALVAAVPCHRVSRCVGLRDLGPFGSGTGCGMLARFESNRLMSELDARCSVKFIRPNHMNMDDFLRRKLLFDSSVQFFRFLIKIGTGFYPAEVTVSECLKTLRTMSPIRNLYEMMTLQEDHLLPDAGSGTLTECRWDVLVKRLVARIGEDNIVYSSEVTEVLLSGEDFVTIRTVNGLSVRARFVVLAVPCCDLLRINISPARTVPWRRPNERLGVHWMTNFTFRYPVPYWRDHGFSGKAFLPERGLLCYELENNQLSGTVFTGGVDGLLPDEGLLRSNTLHLLRNLFRCRSLLHPLSFRLITMPVPFYFDVQPSHRRRMIFATTNISCWYRGFINGSINGGVRMDFPYANRKRAAILALLELRPQIITYQDAIDMQCMQFKFFEQCTIVTRYWYSINLADIVRFFRVSGTALCVAYGAYKIVSQLRPLHWFRIKMTTYRW